MTPWVPPAVDTILPEPTFDMCSESYQTLVLQHLKKVVNKVEKEYKLMPTHTQQLSELKAKAGADLYNLQQKHQLLNKSYEETMKSSMTKGTIRTRGHTGSLRNPETVVDEKKSAENVQIIAEVDEENSYNGGLQTSVKEEYCATESSIEKDAIDTNSETKN